MNRRRAARPSSLSWVIPAGIVAATLIALVVMPVVLNDQLNDHRSAIQLRAEPARHDLNEVNYQLSIQVSSLNRAILTGRPSFQEIFLEAGADRQQAMDRLARDVATMDPHTIRRFGELERALEQWERSVQTTIGSPAEAAAAMTPGQSDYVEVVEAVKGLDEAISGFQTVHSAEIERLMQMQVRITFILIGMALIAFGSVLWLVTRLQSMAVRLEQESADRMEGLEREREARSTAEALVRARDEILGIVSHDLRSPLSTITLSTQMLPGSTAEQQAEHVEMVLSAAGRMERLIRDLLDAVKLESSSLAIHREVLDPAVIARNVFQSHLPIAREKEIDMSLDLEDSLPGICADRDRIAQALGNLLGNALKFTPEKGNVRLRARAEDGFVRFEIRDSGTGISESDMPHLFDPFWQSKKTAHLGAGLGLKITRAIVEAHGGTIEVTNASSGGACFTIQIPVDTPKP